MTEFGEELVKAKATGKLIRRKEFRKLWHLSYHDGPINGIGILDNQFCFFDAYYEGDFRRIFACYPLSVEEFKQELYTHELFRIYVGFHTDYHLPDGDGHRKLGYTQKDHDWDKFKSMAMTSSHTRNNFIDREPIAYFS